MKRDLAELANRSFDVVIVGAGVYGAAAAWDASLRGLSVALIDQGDFGSGTSFNNLKTVHGGIRYLQHADLKRMRESIRERRTLLRIAPHLIHPLPFVVPTYRGRFKQGRLAMGLALAMNDAVGWDRNRHLSVDKHLPRSRLISRQECLEMVPGLDGAGLTGGALWYDAQMYNSDRVTLSFVLSAANRGAAAANFVRAKSVKIENGRARGVTVEDTLSGDRFDVHANSVLNAAGPWVDHFLATLNGSRPETLFHFSKAMNLITRSIGGDVAVGITSRNEHRDADAVVQFGRRFLCVIPWRGHSLVGTAHMAHSGGPDTVESTEAEIEELLADVNHALPGASLRRDDVRFVHRGLLPAARLRTSSLATASVNLAKSYRIHDHQSDGVGGLVSLVGVKYTTARDVAEKAVDRITAFLDKTAESSSAHVPLEGGEIEGVEHTLDAIRAEFADRLTDSQITRLVKTYGSRAPRLAKQADANDLRPIAEGTDVLRFELRHAVRDEMAVDLESIVLRRTELGSAGHPGTAILRESASLASQELDWSPAEVDAQIARVESFFRSRS